MILHSACDDLKAPKGEWLVKNGEKAVLNVVKLLIILMKKSNGSGVVVLKKYGMQDRNSDN